jgi:hypothetical protein
VWPSELAVLLLVSLLMGPPTPSDTLPAWSPSAFHPAPGTAGWARGRVPSFDEERLRPDPRLRSIAIPGWGQQALGQRRWMLYLASEGAGWIGFVDRRRRHGTLTGRYRDLAWDEARTGFSTPPRQDGPWDYYERLLRFEASGRFDLEPTAPRLVPESDPTTFNGRIWILAQEIHLPGGPGSEPDPDAPRYEQALEYYRDRAIRPEFAWDWAGNADARARYAELIRRSDAAAHRATTFIGLLLINRFVSLVDAHLSTSNASMARFRLGSDLRPRPSVEGHVWELTILIFP